MLAGGWYFATQVARVLGGAGGALTPEQGAQLLRASAVREHELDRRLVRCVLGAVIVVGFAWYERTHPSTRVLALVATLAAMAALGRVAFAALPNVKPTTDIVLIAGYVLGGAPGFMVGAIAALASNLFFGQGPWTPWQMVALGRRRPVRRRRWRGSSATSSARVPLAAACGLAGLGFGAVMNSTAGSRSRRPLDGAADRLLRHLAAVRHRARDRQRASSASRSGRRWSGPCGATAPASTSSGSPAAR